MKKIILLLITLIVFSTPLFSSWDDYKDTSFDKLISIIDETTKDDDAKNTLTVYSEKLKIKFNITNYPGILDEETITNKNIYAKMFKNYDVFSTNFNSKINYKYKDIDFVFIFQDLIIKPLHEEVKLNTEVELYILLALYNDFTKKVYIFVNDFQLINKDKSYTYYKE